MKKCTVLLSVFLFSIACLFSGPFGLEMGQSLAELQELGVKPTTLTGRIGYYMVTPPSGHNEFEDYLVRIDPSEGVFLIKAIGKDIADSGYGINTKSHFDDIRSMLGYAYGSSELTDFLFSGSIWDEREDWMMGLAKDERFYMESWDLESGSVLPKDIKEIYLAANALSSSKGYLTLEYYGIKYDELSEKAKRAAAQVF